MTSEPYYKRIKIGLPKLTRYELARILGARALQLTMGATPLIDPETLPTKNPISIAELELELGILPITIRRRTPSGEYQSIPLKWLLEATREIRSTLKLSVLKEVLKRNIPEPLRM